MQQIIWKIDTNTVAVVVQGKISVKSCNNQDFVSWSLISVICINVSSFGPWLELDDLELLLGACGYPCSQLDTVLANLYLYFYFLKLTHPYSPKQSLCTKTSRIHPTSPSQTQKNPHCAVKLSIRGGINQPSEKNQASDATFPQGTTQAEQDGIGRHCTNELRMQRFHWWQKLRCAFCQDVGPVGQELLSGLESD